MTKKKKTNGIEIIKLQFKKKWHKILNNLQ